MSVGVELLGRPTVLFLDEPTSGLDPAAEFKMMELLRHLADGGCTVVCTTHVMENVYLTDRLFIIAAGELVFAGESRRRRGSISACRSSTSPLRPHRANATPSEWRADFRRRRRRRAASPPNAAAAPAAARPAARHAAHPAAALPVLLRRQWAILARTPRISSSSSASRC